MIENIKAESPLIDEKLKSDLTGVFSKLTEDVELRIITDPAVDKGTEVLGFMAVIASLNPHIHLQAWEAGEENAPDELDQTYLPVTGIYKEGKYSGASFHGIPGGQEINPFVIALYNVGGPGQEISRWTVKKIQKIDKKVNVKICVSLACHHCPKVVAACQRIAVLNDNVEAEMIDATLFKDLVDQYKIERVPLIIVNDRQKFAGEKTVEEMIDILKKV